MRKIFLILFVLGLPLFKVSFAETISSSANTGKDKDNYNTVTSHQHGAPAKVVKQSPNINPIVVVPVAPAGPRPSAPNTK
ncbi:MAG: hypothetical protein ACOYL2_07280 [Burkholderiaceae bacterium]|jgi:hypothetical protein|nr:hypothetical protein [Polynucleobacter sp.]MCF8188390.1 hypothetical protein [Sulfuritalea sp.]